MDAGGVQNLLMASKKRSAKNARAKRLENIAWLIKVTVQQPKNKTAFDKSYFGSEYINKKEP